MAGERLKHMALFRCEIFERQALDKILSDLRRRRMRVERPAALLSDERVLIDVRQCFDREILEQKRPSNLVPGRALHCIVLEHRLGWRLLKVKCLDCRDHLLWVASIPLRAGKLAIGKHLRSDEPENEPK